MTKEVNLPTEDDLKQTRVLREWIFVSGLTTPEIARRINAMGYKISTEYLRVIIKGQRPLRVIRPTIRDGIRKAIGMSSEKWLEHIPYQLPEHEWDGKTHIPKSLAKAQIRFGEAFPQLQQQFWILKLIEAAPKDLDRMRVQDWIRILIPLLDTVGKNW